MARIRTIKPSLFKHGDLFRAEKETGLPLRLIYMGLFCSCDRRGRFKWRPEELKLDIVPWDQVDFEKCLLALWQYEFISCYALVTNPSRRRRELFGFVPTWESNQRIRNDEADSILPDPYSQECEMIDLIPLSRSVSDEPVPSQCRIDSVEGKGREGKGKDNIPGNVVGLVESGPTKLERKFTVTTIRIENEIYAIYPRKEGKQKGLLKAQAQIRSPKDFSDMKIAAANFRRHHESKRTETKFIAHFDTWINSKWRDFIHPEKSEDFSGKDFDLDEVKFEGEES